VQFLKAAGEMEQRLLAPSTMSSKEQDKYDEDKGKKPYLFTP
jgi:hypothetical protein